MKNIALVGLLALSTLLGCADDTAGEGDGSDGSEGESENSNKTTGGACASVLEGSWSLHDVTGPSMCSGYAPLECEVSQTNCGVTLDCDGFDTALTLEIDASGVTESGQVSLGDGVVAECHAEYEEQFGSSVGDVYSLSVVCSAQGVSCQYGEGKIFGCEDDDVCDE